MGKQTNKREALKAGSHLRVLERGDSEVLEDLSSEDLMLREFVIKGFVLDDERLKLNKRFGKDYFDELIERVREIRASERRLSEITLLVDKVGDFRDHDMPRVSAYRVLEVDAFVFAATS